MEDTFSSNLQPPPRTRITTCISTTSRARINRCHLVDSSVASDSGSVVGGSSPATAAGCAEEDANLISLHWNDSESFLLGQLRKLWNQMEMTDVSLSCEGKIFKAHKLILTLWSPYFRQLFDATSQFNAHPIIVFRDTLARDLELLLQYMYQGQVFVGQKEADRFLKTAEALEIAGLDENIRRCTAAVISTDQNQCQKASSTSASTVDLEPVVASSTESARISIPSVVKRNSQAIPLPSYEEIQPRKTARTSKSLPVRIRDSATCQSNDQTSEIRTKSFVVASQSTESESQKTDEGNETNNNVVYIPATTFTTTPSSICTASTSDVLRSGSAEDEMIFSHVMQMQEPIPIREVEEAVAAANSSSDGQSLLLLSLNQSEIFHQDPEIARDGTNNVPSNNSLLGSNPGISPYASFILPDLDHQYTTIAEGHFTSPFANEGIILPHQQITILQQHPHYQQSISSVGIESHETTSTNEVEEPTSGSRNPERRVFKIEQDTKSEIQFIPCPKCGKYVKEQSLKVHLKRSHLAEGVTLNCPICTKKLKSKGVYYKHMFVHRQKGEVPKKVPKSSQKQRRPYNGKSQQQGRPASRKQPNSRVSVTNRSSINAKSNEPGPSTSMPSPCATSAGGLSTTVNTPSDVTLTLLGGTTSENMSTPTTPTSHQEQYQFRFEQL